MDKPSFNALELVPTEPQRFLDLPANKLLDEFGRGGHKPGSGAAAALMVMLAVKLNITVAKLTIDKKPNGKISELAAFYIKSSESEIYPRIVELFDRDNEVFHEVIKIRQERDKARLSGDEALYKAKRREELGPLQVAIEIPLEIGEIALRVARFSQVLFDEGFHAVRGDSGAAASVALSAAKSSVFIAYLNLKKFRSSKWSRRARERGDSLLDDAEKMEYQMMSRVTALGGEGADLIHPTLFDLNNV